MPYFVQCLLTQLLTHCAAQQLHCATILNILSEDAATLQCESICLPTHQSCGRRHWDVIQCKITFVIKHNENHTWNIYLYWCINARLSNLQVKNFIQTRLRLISSDKISFFHSPRVFEIFTQPITTAPGNYINWYTATLIMTLCPQILTLYSLVQGGPKFS